MPRPLRSCTVCGSLCYGTNCRKHCQPRTPRGPYRPRHQNRADMQPTINTALFTDRQLAAMPTDSWWIAEDFYAAARAQMPRMLRGTGISYQPKESLLW